jgi:GNAT superfamily N-acetyltransferase
MTRRFKPLTPQRVNDLPAPCDCCTFWETAERLEPSCGHGCERDATRQWVRTVRREWGDCGRVAYEDGEVLGFVKYAPGSFLPQTRHMPVGVPDAEAVLLACIHVAPGSRRHGLGGLLLQAALRDLAARGERVLEAYAVADRDAAADSPMTSADFLLDHGFTVARPHPVYPLMRLELTTLAAWTDSLEAALAALQLPLRVGVRAPAPLAGSR